MYGWMQVMIPAKGNLGATLTELEVAQMLDTDPE